MVIEESATHLEEKLKITAKLRLFFRNLCVILPLLGRFEALSTAKYARLLVVKTCF